MLEAMAVVTAMSSIAFLIPLFWNQCTPLPVDMEEWSDQEKLLVSTFAWADVETVESEREMNEWINERDFFISSAFTSFEKMMGLISEPYYGCWLVVLLNGSSIKPVHIIIIIIIIIIITIIQVDELVPLYCPQDTHYNELASLYLTGRCRQ